MRDGESQMPEPRRSGGCPLQSRRVSPLSRILLLVVGSLAAVALLLPTAGCSCGTPYNAVVCGNLSGGASVSAPAELGLGTTLAIRYANTCLNVDGSCSLPPNFGLVSTDNRLSVDATFPETASAMTFTLPSPDVSVSAFLMTGSATSQPTVSGTVTIESVSPSGFQTSFDLQLMTDDGQVITITGGEASASGCGVQQRDSSCSSFS